MKTKSRKRYSAVSAELRSQRQQEALDRATSGASLKNDLAVIEQFAARGIDATPRVDVFTFNAWKAQGRSVKPGEHGVSIVTLLPVNAPKGDQDEATPPADTGDDENATGRPQVLKKKGVTVFHISQTENEAERAARRQREANAPAVAATASEAPTIQQAAPVTVAPTAEVLQDSLF